MPTGPSKSGDVPVTTVAITNGGTAGIRDRCPHVEHCKARAAIPHKRKISISASFQTIRTRKRVQVVGTGGATLAPTNPP